MAKIVKGLHREWEGRPVPVILFTKKWGAMAGIYRRDGCSCSRPGLTTDIGLARSRIGDRVALQGNMDPGVLLGTPERIREEVATSSPGLVRERPCVQPGARNHSEVDPENARVFIDAVHELSGRYHA